MSDLLPRLKRANQTLSTVVTLLSSGPSANAVITPNLLESILTEILGVGESLQHRGIPDSDPEVDIQIHQYRSHLEQLRTLMPYLHAQLLTERAHLEAERSHLETASAWAEVSHTTR